MKFISKFQFWFRLDNNNKHFTRRPVCVSVRRGILLPEESTVRNVGIPVMT